MRRFLISMILAGAMLCGLSSRAIAHVEGVEISMDLIADRNRATAELRVPIVALIQSEQPPDSVEQPNFKQDAMEVAKKHAEYMVESVLLNFDTTEMKPRLIGTSVQSLLLGVNSEDVVPRQCAVYQIEFTTDASPPPPALIVARHTMFRLPDDAGFQPTVLCLINFRQLGQTTVRSDLLGLDETLKFKCQWPEIKPQVSPTMANITLAQTAPSGPQQMPPSGVPRKPMALGPMIMLGISGLVIVVMAIVLAKQKRL